MSDATSQAAEDWPSHTNTKHGFTWGNMTVRREGWGPFFTLKVNTGTHALFIRVYPDGRIVPVERPWDTPDPEVKP